VPGSTWASQATSRRYKASCALGAPMVDDASPHLSATFPFLVIFVLFLVFSWLSRSKGLLTHAPAAGATRRRASSRRARPLRSSSLHSGIIYAVGCLALLPGGSASVVEDLKARKALRRSVELSRGSLGRISFWAADRRDSGRAGADYADFFVSQPQSVEHHGTLPLWCRWRSSGGLFTNAFIVPDATALPLLLRPAHPQEGFDIEWMMQAAGLTAPAVAAEPGAARRLRTSCAI